MRRRGFLTAAVAATALSKTGLKGAQATARDDYTMKLGQGLSGDLLSKPETLMFLRQLGVTHIVAHSGLTGGIIPGTDFWELDDLVRLRKYINSYGMELASMESFPSSHNYKILLGQPGREVQIENIKKTIRNMGKAGIPVMGYHFSLAKVWGSVTGTGRGGARVRRFDYDLVRNGPLMTVSELMGTKPEAGPLEVIQPVSQEEMWDRLAYFLKNVVPVAEEARVRLAAHPDDPPVPTLRGTGRLITSHAALQRLLDVVPSYYSGLNFCQGTVAEIGEDIYKAIRRFGEQKKICYVHFRNIKGHPPNNFDEAFVDEGDVDMVKAMRIYKELKFDGVMMPDHTNTVTCPAPWYAGFAFALGYMKALMQAA